PAVDISAWPARTGRTWSGAWSAIRAWRRLRAWLREVDVVHAHGHQAGVLAVLAAATSRRRPRVVISWHNAVLGTGAARRVRALAERLQALRADLVTGASEDLVRRAAQLGAHAVLAPVAAPDAGTWSGDASAERRAVAQELGLDPEAAWALTVSRIAPQKNLDVLVEAAGRSKRSPLEWVVVGDGDEQLRSRLAAMVEDGGARVHLLGARRDVPRLMAVADVLVVPSAWEARALVVQEAMAAGLPGI